jgi:hypothetical protein
MKRRNEIVSLAAKGWSARRTGEYVKFKSDSRKVAQWDISGPCPGCRTLIGFLALRSRSDIRWFEPSKCHACQGIPDPHAIDPEYERLFFASSKDYAAFLNKFA